MKQTIIALLAAAAFVGCNQQKAEQKAQIERNKEAQQKALDREKDAMGAAANDAKKQIETLMSTAPDPKYVAEHKQAVEDAKKLLQKIDSES